MTKLEESYHLMSQSLRITGISSDRQVYYMNELVFSEDIQKAFDIFFFIRMIDDYSGSYANEISQLEGKYKKAYNFFLKNSAHIEIIFEGKIEKVYFMKHPACNYLDSENKISLMNEVRRDSPNEKITDFISE